MADVRLEGSADIATANTNQNLLNRSSAQMCSVITNMGYIDNIVANNRNSVAATGYLYIRPAGDAASNAYRFDFVIPPQSNIAVLPTGAKLWVISTDLITVNASMTGVNIIAMGVAE